MKLRFTGIVVALLLAMLIVALFWNHFFRKDNRAALPNPNGYDDYAAAAQSMVAWNGDLNALPSETVQGLLSQNAKTFEAVRRGLKKESAMPVRYDKDWLPGQINQEIAFKRIGQLLAAEGSSHLADGRTNEAARSFTDCILFGHATHRGGLMIHHLVAIACQAIGTRRLVAVAPDLSPEAVRAILGDLLALDRARDPASVLLQRERQWSLGASSLWQVMSYRIVLRSKQRAMELSFEQKETRSVAALRLLITDLAVRGYQAKNGRPPTTLVELVPSWLPAVPLDPFTQRPLIYRVKTNSFELYSIGPDGKDDQGRPVTRGKPDSGDLVPSSL